MAPIIRAVLSNLVGEKDANEIEIIANDANVRPDGSWEIKYRHPSRSVTLLILRLSKSDGHQAATGTTNRKLYFRTASFRTPPRYSSSEMASQVRPFFSE